MSKIVVLIETNGNWYLQDGTGKVLEADKNALIKEVAARIGVSILTSDEVGDSGLVYLKESHVAHGAAKESVAEKIKVELDIDIADKILFLLKQGCYSAELITTLIDAINKARSNALFKTRKPENPDWDTEPISHDGIQFNQHFIDLKLKVNSLETEIVKLKNK